jgi:DNA helicase HerA-like ATPase
LLACLRGDTEIQGTYSAETVRALTQRLKSVSALTFFSGEPTHLSALIRPGRLSIILLNRLPDTLRSVLTGVLMRRVLAERSEASELRKQLKFNRQLTQAERQAIEGRISELIPPAVVALDEAQNALPSERATKATETIIKYVREGRNHGLSFVFTTQQPSAIDARILAQVDTILGHKLTIGADVRRFEENLKSRLPDSVQLSGRELGFVDWLRSLGQGQTIVSNTEEDRCFVVDVRPRICPHGGQGAV